MNIAYLLNAYPMTSTTFIRREIEALEELGLAIRRYAIRRWAVPLVDPQDLAEQARAHYLLSANIGGLIGALAKEVFINPVGLYRSSSKMLDLFKNSGGGLVRHVAYLMEAIYFRQSAKKDGIDHVHTHFATNATAVAMLSHLMGGPSYSFTVHGPDEFVDPLRLSFELKARHAAFVVAISDYCRDQLVRLIGFENKGKIVVARCGIAVNELRPASDCSEESDVRLRRTALSTEGPVFEFRRLLLPSAMNFPISRSL